MTKPELLRVPQRFASVAELCGTASQLDLPNALLISEMLDGSLVFLDTGMTLCEANWLIDRFKALLVSPTKKEIMGDD